MRSTFPVVGLAAMLSLVASDVARGQLCFGGGRRPGCKAFVVTDFSLSVQLNEEGYTLMPELGAMRNLDGRQALGLTWFVEVMNASPHQGHFRHGPKIRYRYWINEIFNVDVGAGLMFTEPDYDLIDFFGESYINLLRWLGVGLRVESWEDTYLEPNVSNRAVYSTVKLGSYAGMSTTVLGSALLLVVLFTIGAAG